MSDDLNPFSKELDGFFKAFLGMVALIVVANVLFWGAVIAAGVFLFVKYLV